MQTPEGLRALSKDRPISPDSVHRYFRNKFGDLLPRVRHAVSHLARSLSALELAASAYTLYEQFRPEIPAGVRGWGAAGRLDLALIEDRSTGHGLNRPCRAVDELQRFDRREVGVNEAALYEESTKPIVAPVG